MKTEVYSWRVSTELKTGLEREARNRGISLSAALDTAAREWLKKNRAEIDSDEEQIRLHQAAARYVGAISGGDPRRSQRVGELVRERLSQRHGR
jgi:hypothetical protein